MKIDIDLKSGFLQNLKREVLDSLNTEERAIIEVSTGEMGNKPDAVKLGWLKMRTKETWTKQRYTKALGRTMEKLREAVAAAEKKKATERRSVRARFAPPGACPPRAPCALPARSENSRRLSCVRRLAPRPGSPGDAPRWSKA